jgi:predicted acetyltransferase/uncharacterized protein YhfF
LEPLPSIASAIEKLRARGIEIPSGPVRVDSYGDSPELSASLIALIRAGPKRAGTSLLWALEAENEPLPEAGQIEIVVDHRNEPVLITRITRVEVLPYASVTAEYAAIEGEGDGSLEYWREAHWAFFSRECERLGREASESMPVVCSVFEVLIVVPDELELVRPSEGYCDSYRGLVAEFVAAGEPFVPFTLAFDATDFAAFLAKLDDCSLGLGIPEGFVAHSTFWLVRNQTEVVGVSNIRHSLTPALRREGGNIGYGIRPSARRQGLGVVILRNSLRRAAELGLTRVLVTCGKHNVASARTIVGNGGVLESEEYLASRDEVVQRYWIDNIPDTPA